MLTQYSIMAAVVPFFFDLGKARQENRAPPANIVEAEYMRARINRRVTHGRC